VRAFARMTALPHVLSARPKGVGQPTSRWGPVLAFLFRQQVSWVSSSPGNRLEVAWVTRRQNVGKVLVVPLDVRANGSTNRFVGAVLGRSLHVKIGAVSVPERLAMRRRLNVFGRSGACPKRVGEGPFGPLSCSD